MTKQHFIALADMIRKHNASDLEHKFSTYQINQIADFCKTQNPRFDEDRWLGYIAGTNGPNGGKK